MADDGNQGKIVKPKDAATVMLLRQRGKAFEVLMVLRHQNNKFVANSYVYPGGALDEEDLAADMDPFCRGMDRAKAARVLADMVPREKALGIWVAGIRETFEEVGLLLAYHQDGAPVTFSAEREIEKFCAYRDSLLKGGENGFSFREMLGRERLTLAADRLHYFSHWVTPELLPIRYDVRFFVAEAPPEQEALHDGCELVEHVWITPQDALAAYERRSFGLVLPTIVTLKELCSFKTVEEVIRSTAGKNIPRILTKMTRKGGRPVEIMPDGTVFGPSPV